MRKTSETVDALRSPTRLAPIEAGLPPDTLPLTMRYLADLTAGDVVVVWYQDDLYIAEVVTTQTRPQYDAYSDDPLRALVRFHDGSEHWFVGDHQNGYTNFVFGRTATHDEISLWKKKIALR